MFQNNSTRRMLERGLPLVIALGGLWLFPFLELAVFARSAAAIAGLLTGAPVIGTEQGWVLPFPRQVVLVNESCSGATYFIMVTALLSWHQNAWGGSGRVYWKISLALGLAFLITSLVNGFRVTTLAQAHLWLFPHLPEKSHAFAHLLTGVAVFLPSLILVNLVLEWFRTGRISSPDGSPRSF